MTVVAAYRLGTQTTQAGPWRNMRVVVHDTTAALQAASRRSRAAVTGEGIDRTDAVGILGCFEPRYPGDLIDTATWTTDRTRPRSVTHPYLGTLRLTLEAWTVEVVVHEVVHAATAAYRVNWAKHPRLGYGCGTAEERLAYVIGQLADTVLHTLAADPRLPALGTMYAQRYADDPMLFTDLEPQP